MLIQPSGTKVTPASLVPIVRQAQSAAKSAYSITGTIPATAVNEATTLAVFFENTDDVKTANVTNPIPLTFYGE